MGSLVIRLIEKLRISLWIVPASMATVAAALGYGLVAAERHTFVGETVPSWLKAGSADGVSQLLATVAGSMITVAGVTFSITVVGLSLASQQFGPRILRNFMSDRNSQVILGCFVSTFLYCIVVLRGVRDTDDLEFVPHYAVAGAILLTLTSIGFLIWFFHHFASSIVVERVLAHVGREFQWSIDRAYPAGGAEVAPPREDPFRTATLIVSKDDGYVLGVDFDELLEVTSNQDLALEILANPGTFMFPGRPLARVGGTPRLSEETADRIREAFPLGTHRTPTQDVDFAISQLVEVGLRALSPSLNDPNTAIATIDRLSAGLVHRAHKSETPPWRGDDQARARILTHPLPWDECVALSFLRLLHAGRDIPVVPIHMLTSIGAMLRIVPESRREALVRMAVEVRNQAIERISSPIERTRIENAWAVVAEAIEEAASPAVVDKLAV